jgi:hypothetical protein
VVYDSFGTHPVFQDSIKLYGYNGTERLNYQFEQMHQELDGFIKAVKQNNKI